jgi:hypothetical protein
LHHANLVILLLPVQTYKNSLKKTKNMKEISNTLNGIWTYRSFENDPNIEHEPNDILFGQAILTLKEVSLNKFHGVLDMLAYGKLIIEGSSYHGYPMSMTFRGIGIPDTQTAGWIYDYYAIYVPQWNNGINQRPALVGSVIRTVEHGPQSPAGEVASFFIVKHG